jgi:hypothetical protein
VDHSIDQFGPRVGRHGLVEGVKRRLVEPLTVNECVGHGDLGHAIGHEPPPLNFKTPTESG